MGSRTRDRDLIASLLIVLSEGTWRGRNEPLRQIRPRPMKHRSRRHRLLPVTRAALVNPRPGLQPPSRPPAAARTHKTAGPAKPGQVLDAPLLRPEPRCKL
jgi:hypothetical protein